MSSLLLVLTSIALLDATSITPLCIMPLIALMSTSRPLAATTGFLAGILVSYVAFGVLVVFGLQAVIEQLGRWFVDWWNHPDTLDAFIGIAIGAAMVVFGSRLEGARESDDDRGLGDVSPIKAFSGGFTLTIVGSPGALPLFAAVDQILGANLSAAGNFSAIFFYSVVFIMPLASVLVARIAIGDRIEPALQRLNAGMARWGHRAIVFGLVALGLVLVADGVGWLLGHPLLPTFAEPT